MRNLMKTAAVTAASLALWAGHVQAAPITTLFNTGVNDDGSVRTDNQAELHYKVLVGVVLNTPFVATAAGGYPIGPWISGAPWDSTSAWISPTEDTNGPTFGFNYRTTFDLTGLDPLTASILGMWATDNEGQNILINGVATGSTSSSFTSFSPFLISSGFVAGINTLDFIVYNGGGPTGLRVEIASATADVLTVQAPADVHEPITLSLFGAGLAGIAAMRRRRRT